MCGIVGSIGQNPTSNLSNVFTSVLNQTEVRGRHATGVAALTPDNCLYLKYNIPATTFTRTKPYGKVVNDNAQILLGHCRYATCGDPAVNANNHPFVTKSGRFIFAHNGKVGTLDKLRRSGLDVTIESETDSEYLLKTIEALVHTGISVTKAIKDSVALFPQAEFACILIDCYTQTLYLWRNYMRPLWVWDCTKYTGTHIISSTKTIFRKAMLDCGYTMKQVDAIKGFQFAPYMVYSITLDGCISMSQINEQELGFKILHEQKKPKARNFHSTNEVLRYLDSLSGNTSASCTTSRRTFGTDVYEDGAFLSDDDAPFDEGSTIDEAFQNAMNDLNALEADGALSDAESLLALIDEREEDPNEN